MIYIVNYAIRCGVSNGLGTKFSSSLDEELRFSSIYDMPEELVGHAKNEIRRSILLRGYLTDPEDSCVTARLVSLRRDDGVRVPFEDGTNVRVS